MRGYILLMGGTERVYVEEYRRRVEQRILELVDTHPDACRPSAAGSR